MSAVKPRKTAGIETMKRPRPTSPFNRIARLTPFNRLAGIAFPLTLACYGLGCAIFGAGPFGDRLIPPPLDRFPTAFGLICISVGAFTHCRLLWNDGTDRSALVPLAEDVWLMTFISSLLYIVARAGVFR
jgi:hypothetical protein